MIADEPTANLDSKTGDTILDMLFSLTEDSDTVVILSSHDPALISRHDKRQIRLIDGLIVEDEPIAQKKVAGL